MMKTVLTGLAINRGLANGPRGLELELDDQGRADLARLLAETHERLERAETEAKERMAGTPARRVSVLIGVRSRLEERRR